MFYFSFESSLQVVMKCNDHDYEKKRWVGCQAGPFRSSRVSGHILRMAHQDKRRQRAMTKHDHQQSSHLAPLYFHTQRETDVVLADLCNVN